MKTTEVTEPGWYIHEFSTYKIVTLLHLHPGGCLYAAGSGVIEKMPGEWTGPFATKEEAELACRGS